MSTHPKLLLLVSVVAGASFLALWSRSVDEETDVTAAPPLTSASLPLDAPRLAEAARPIGPSAEEFAARIEAVIPRLEAHVAAAAERSDDQSAEVCTRDAKTRSTQLDAIARTLFDGELSSTWTDDEARALAVPVAEAEGPVRRCVACAPRRCADAARALVRVENALHAYRLRHSGS
jgi:hypothetical protein